MVFALMSGKKKKDYKAVFKAVIEMLPVQPAVKGIVIDYEMAVWSALREVHRNASWRPSCWSVYLRSVRTNNDVEGWHHGLNRRCHGKTQLPFYVLIQLLHEEAKLVSLQIRLVSERKLKRMQRSVYRQLQSRIFTLWKKYKSGERTSKQLLRACARLYGPRDI